MHRDVGIGRVGKSASDIVLAGQSSPHADMGDRQGLRQAMSMDATELQEGSGRSDCGPGSMQGSGRTFTQRITLTMLQVDFSYERIVGKQGMYLHPFLNLKAHVKQGAVTVLARAFTGALSVSHAPWYAAEDA